MGFYLLYTMNSEVFDSFEACYLANRDKITTKVKDGRIQKLKHYEIKGDLNMVTQLLKEIFRDNLNPFKINISFGYILKSVPQDSFRFYHPSNNNPFLANPKLIQNERDQAALLELCEQDNILEFVYKQTLTSSWVVSSIVCFSVRITPITPTHTMSLRSAGL